MGLSGGMSMGLSGGSLLLMPEETVDTTSKSTRTGQASEGTRGRGRPTFTGGESAETVNSDLEDEAGTTQSAED